MAAVMIEVSEEWTLPIPRPILQEVGLQPGMAVEVVVDDSDQILLRPYEQLSAEQAAEAKAPDAEVVRDVKAERKQAYRERGADE